MLSGPLDGGTELTIEQRPDTIVSLSPTATETLWAVGAGAQVVAEGRNLVVDGTLLQSAKGN